MSANKYDEHEVGIGDMVGMLVADLDDRCINHQLALCVDHLVGLSSIPTESQVHQCTMEGDDGDEDEDDPGYINVLWMGVMPHDSTCIGTAFVVSISTFRA